MTNYVAGGQLTGTAFTPLDYLMSIGADIRTYVKKPVKQIDRGTRFRVESSTLNLPARIFTGRYPSKSDLTPDQEIAIFYSGLMQQQKFLDADLADILARNAKKLYVR